MHLERTTTLIGTAVAACGIPTTERLETRSYPVHFTPTGQCLTQSAELVPYAQRDNVTTYFRTYNSQIESLQVKAAARGVATYLTINGVGLLYPAEAEAICRYSRTIVTPVLRNVTSATGQITEVVVGTNTSVQVLVERLEAMSSTRVR